MITSQWSVGTLGHQVGTASSQWSVGTLGHQAGTATGQWSAGILAHQAGTATGQWSFVTFGHQADTATARQIVPWSANQPEIILNADQPGANIGNKLDITRKLISRLVRRELIGTVARHGKLKAT
ncbi:hypothetical protein ElyMa_001956500 [Elysia marginata]|uniref:Uncharacterized protein n=1 Tax=Elysia marginata TaxID=1093978 RepID=A0AAV4EXS9_9GAST|nr:hypothetical protein ElyMa_001956500 [Elysia marginata]